MTKDWNPHEAPATNPNQGGGDGGDNVLPFPRQAVSAKDDERDSYQNLLVFLAEHADPEAEVSVMSVDDLFGGGK
jgi:hypothetical protein